MITRVAIVPYPPLLVPELTVQAQASTEQLRAACLRAVSSLTEAAGEWVALGVDRSGPCLFGPQTIATFAGFGVDIPVTLGAITTGEPDPTVPLPVLIAGWLREHVGAQEVTVHLLAPTTAPDECWAWGARLDQSPEPHAVLVLADGTNRRDMHSPYPPDPRAATVDSLIRSALAEADSSRLLDLDAQLAAELGVEGRAALQALAGLGGSWRGELIYSETPFGVTYHVAVWSRGE